MRWCTWDVEATDWDQFLLAAAVTDEGEEFVFHTRSELAHFLSGWKGRAYAHFGGRYDLYFLPSPPSELICSGSGILRARYGQATLYDSFFLMQMSLAKIGDAVGLAKSGDGSDVEGMSREEVAEYCLQDCRVLARALTLQKEWVSTYTADRWPATAGSTAMEVLAALEPEAVEMLTAEPIDLDMWWHQRAATRGGRVEVCQWGEVAGPLYGYDIRSSYPASWAEGPLPHGRWVETDHYVGPGLHEVYVEQPRDRIPVVAAGGRWQYDGRCWITDDEWEVLDSVGARVTFLRGLVSDRHVYLGAKFATEMYAEKRRGSPWAKLVINSAHGKTGQRLIHQVYRREGDHWRRDDELSWPSWYQRPAFGAYLLARARLRLWYAMDALQQGGWRVLYCDTDSVHTDCPPDMFPLPLGEELGDWALEWVGREAVYVAPKVYMIRVAGQLEPKIAAKGLPRDAITWEILATAARGGSVVLHDDRGLEGFRQLGGEWCPKRKARIRTLRRQSGGKIAGQKREGCQYLEYSEGPALIA